MTAMALNDSAFVYPGAYGSDNALKRASPPRTGMPPRWTSFNNSAGSAAVAYSNMTTMRPPLGLVGRYSESVGGMKVFANKDQGSSPAASYVMSNETSCMDREQYIVVTANGANNLWTSIALSSVAYPVATGATMIKLFAGVLAVLSVAFM
jgi:hypothetical protein